jgi:hypothetical protein
MVTAHPDHSLSIVRLVARITASLVTLFFLLLYVWIGTSSALYDLHGAVNPQIILTIVLGAVVLAGYILSWRRERAGGILFIVASAGATLAPLIDLVQYPRMIHSVPVLAASMINSWLLVGMPLLAIGILLLAAYGRSRAQQPG